MPLAEIYLRFMCSTLQRNRSNLFSRQAKKLKCALVQQNMKLTIVIVALIIFILIVLAIVIYLIVDKFT